MNPSLNNDNFAKIFYHFHHKHYNLMLKCCKDAIQKNPTNLIQFKLYHSLALMLANRLEEGVHDLEGISQENDIKLAATIALMYGHKYLGVARKEVFLKLDAQMKEYRKNAEAVDLYNAAFVLITFKKIEKSLDYVEKAISLSSNEAEFLTLKGWILIMLRKYNNKGIFKTALEKNPKDLIAILGLTECCLHLNELDEALVIINQAVIKFTNTTNLTLLLQRLKVYLAAQQWDQLSEGINLIGSKSVDTENFLYLINYEILINLSFSGDYKTGAANIRKISEMLKKFESTNSSLITNLSKLYARLCNRNENILTETTYLLENAIQNDVDNAELVVELGYQNYLLGNSKEAIRLFKAATKIDENSFEAFLGLSLCEFTENGKSEALLKQIQFLLDIKDSDQSLLLHLLQARTSENSHDAIKHLDIIFTTKKLLSRTFYFSDRFLLELDPDFTLQVVKEYLVHHTQENSVILEKAFELTNLVAKSCPSLCEAQFLRAQLFYLKGDHNSALEILSNSALNFDAEAHLLMAQIQINNDQYENANQSLESCTSSDFRIRENPLFHFITALVEKHAGNYNEAIKELNTALNLFNPVKKFIDRGRIYIELIDILNIVGNTDEALKVLEEATKDLQGTNEESRILILSADNFLAQKNVQSAIELLEKIQPEDVCYRKAKMKLALILLKYRRDKYAFLEVYKNFAQEKPSAETFDLLGDAYMQILEPDFALENYEKALKENPTDPGLIRKMGKALVDTHYFGRAIEYYKKAIKETNGAELKLELAILYLNIKEYEKGELLLLNEVDDNAVKLDFDDSQLLYRGRLYKLLAQIQEKSGNLAHAIKNLKDSLDCLIRLRKRNVVVDQFEPKLDDVDKELVILSIKLGDMAISMNNKEQAINYYKEGLNISPNNITILVALAKLHMQMNYLELCQQTCNTILSLDQDNEEASVMMADIAFRKVDFDMAFFHFTQLISKQSTNWTALLRFIEISRRMGTIQECEHYLQIAEENCVNSLKEPGFIYCKAYFQWHSGNLNAALKNFNQVRQDAEYGIDALYSMIEICLNPEDEMLSEEFMENDDIEYRDSRNLALKTAERLIKELKQRLESNSDNLAKCRLLMNFRLLASKEKHNIEIALDDFVAIASLNGAKENLGAIFGMATAHTLLKQPQRAKNQLKRIVKNSWTFDDAEYLEKCWLLLADQYLQSNKFEQSKELIGKVLEHNKTCVKALEYFGYICEKEHKFKDAANNYLKAWSIGQKNNANIGYKLAYCLMKCKKYPDSIDVANEVLKLNPEYSNIKKDILDKCMNNLRI